jgi:hypothetical protein
MTTPVLQGPAPGRIGQPTDVAAAALFLTPQASAWITLDVAGGRVML